MPFRRLAIALAALGVMGTNPVLAATSNGTEDAAVPGLQRMILAELAGATGDADAMMAAITRATRGAALADIAEAVCPLQRVDLAGIYGSDSAAIAQAQATLARPEVREAVPETCQIAQLALASYGATGGVAAGGAPGQAFGSGGIGAPGGGGGSGYID